YQTAEAFRALAREAGVHPVTLAVAWVASQPGVTAPIVGARSVEQLEPAIAALDFALDPDLRARVSGLYPEPPPATDRSAGGRARAPASTSPAPPRRGGGGAGPPARRQAGGSRDGGAFLRRGRSPATPHARAATQTRSPEALSLSLSRARARSSAPRSAR